LKVPDNKKMYCPTAVTLEEAEARCAAEGARLCTADELTDDVARGTGCKLDRARIWTASECPADDRAVASASTKLAANKIKPICKLVDAKLKFRCCADFAPGTELHNVAVAVEEVKATGKAKIVIEWRWTAYDQVKILIKKVLKERTAFALAPKGFKVQTVTAENGVNQFSIGNLDAGSRYKVKIVPWNSKGKLVPMQGREIAVITP
jgi:hypothetical protein